MADSEDIRELLKNNDAQTLAERTRRMAEVKDYSYERVCSPLIELVKELDKLYINGHFMATIIFASTIVEYVLRGKLYPKSKSITRVDNAGLGTLCTMAERAELLSENSIQQVRLVNKMRNTVIHVDTSFAQELMDAAIPEIEDPIIRMSWFFGGSQLSLMATTCADIARKFAIAFSNY